MTDTQFIELVQRGFNAAQIAKIEAAQAQSPTQAPTPAPTQAPTPAPTQAPTPAPNNLAAQLLQEMQALRQSVQMGNMLNTGLGTMQQETTGDILASIINPPEISGANNSFDMNGGVNFGK